MSITNHKTQIITTIGPASLNKQTLEFFASHNVSIARLNCSHNTPDSHYEAGTLARAAGLEILMDLQGPKIRLGEVTQVLEAKIGEEIILEQAKANVEYPYKNGSKTVFPYEFPAHKFLAAGHRILVDDGKLEFLVTAVNDSSVDCEVTYGGEVKSRKGMNMPDTDLQVDFLQPRDLVFLNDLIPRLQPDYVAASFVKTVEDMNKMKNIVSQILNEHNITDYLPKFCAKIEMGEAVTDKNLAEITDGSDLIMIARGDLALETTPAHLSVPFLQEKIKNVCRAHNKPFVVATQVLESMITSPVATRAEVSDLYRAVKTDRADYVMLSGESAIGMYPRNCIQLMSDMIEMVTKLEPTSVNIAVSVKEKVIA
ncbi:MAG: hypothetical protein H7230_04480 [Candidatus Parcubacteria bacterium]|nr:hypothetical protein [Candidatus Paceibacterota bacterium]